MNHFILFFIKNSKLTNVLAFFLLSIGCCVFLFLPRQHMPDVSLDIVDIQTIYPGASPEEIETNVTDMIEDQLESVDSIKKMISYSFQDVSHILVKIDPDIKQSKKNKIKQDIRDKVFSVKNLPEDIESGPTVTERNSSDKPSIELVVFGKNASELELRKVSKNLKHILRRNCSQISNIQMIGYRDKELHILSDIHSMNKYNLTFSELFHAIQSCHVTSSSGKLESIKNGKNIVTSCELKRPLDIANGIVRSNFSGKKVLIKDVAICKEDFSPRDLKCIVNGSNAINIILNTNNDSDVIKMSKKVHHLLEDYKRVCRKQYKNVNIEMLVDYTDYTKRLLNITKINGLCGLFFIFICLVIFLDIGIVLWVCFGLTVSLFGAFILFPFFGLTMNHIVLLSIIIVLGLLVDDAIIVSENIARYRESGMDAITASFEGAKKVLKPVTGTILTTISCFIPMYFMNGVMGKFIFSIPTVIIAMLLVGFFESFTILPCHLAHTKPSSRKPIGYGLMNLMRSWYRSALRFCLQWRSAFLLISCLFLIFAYFFSYKNYRFVLFPDSNIDIFYILFKTEKGDSLQQTERTAQKILPHLKAIPPSCLKNFKIDIGHQHTLDFEISVEKHHNWGVVSVFLLPANDRPISSEEIIAKLEENLDGIRSEFTSLEIKKMHKGPPVGHPVEINLISDKFNLCKKYDKKIRETLKSIAGVYDIESSYFGKEKEIEIHFDREKMIRYQVSPEEVCLILRMAFQGVSPFSMTVFGEKMDFRLRLNEEQRQDIQVLQKIKVKNAMNQDIFLKDIAQFKEKKTIRMIRHYDGEKSIRIIGKVDLKVITPSEVAQIIQNMYSLEIANNPHIEMMFGGEEKETKEGLVNLLIAFILAVISIYSILIIVLDSYIQPFLILFALPFGIIFVFILFYYNNRPLSFLGMIGMLAMMGVAINDSLVMVSHLNDVFKQKKSKDSTIDLIVASAQTRFRPVILTTLTTILAIVPTIYGIGGYEPFLIPLLLPMSWGLLFCTFISLFLIPVLYSFSFKK